MWIRCSKSNTKLTFTTCFRWSGSVISRLDLPAAVLHGGQPRGPVLGDELEPGPAPRGLRPPPAFGNGPGPGPGGDRQPRPAVGRHPGRGSGNLGPPGDGHRGPG